MDASTRTVIVDLRIALQAHVQACALCRGTGTRCARPCPGCRRDRAALEASEALLLPDNRNGAAECSIDTGNSLRSVAEFGETAGAKP